MSVLKFSLIIPSRGRLERLKECINSFLSRCKHVESLEILVMLDYDDKETLDGFISFAQESKVVIKTVVQKRSGRKIRDYDNFGARCASGKYIWILNDDVVCESTNWDSKVEYNIERFLEDKRDRICYALPRDYGPNYMFPLLTRETIAVLSGIFPDEISGAFADTWLNRIFASLELNRTLELTNVSIKPSVIADQTSIDMRNLSSGLTLTQEEFESYVSRLNEKIKVVSMIYDDYYDNTLKMLEHWVEYYGNTL